MTFSGYYNDKYYTNDKYCQCLLEKGLMRQTSWIPERFAVVDKIIKINVNNVWEDGWKVVKTFKTFNECELDLIRNQQVKPLATFEHFY